MIRIKFFGEGPSDVGKVRKDRKTGKEEKIEFENHMASHMIFVESILEELMDGEVNFECVANYTKDIETHARGYKNKGASGFARKVIQAADHAEERGFDAAVFLVDHDDDIDRLDQLETGRQMAREKGYNIPIILGVPKKMIEAWLLADVEARRKVFGKKGGDDIGDIEMLSNPKENEFEKLYNNLLQEDTSIRDIGKGIIKKSLAIESDLNNVAKECPESFKPFVKEIEENLLTLFKDHK